MKTEDEGMSMPQRRAAGVGLDYLRTLWRSTAALRCGVLDLLMPPRCIGRGCEYRGAWLCAACTASIRPLPEGRCRHCGDVRATAGRCRRCAQAEPAFSAAYCVGAHDGVLRDAIAALKYQGRAALADPLGELVVGVLPAMRPWQNARVVAVPADPHRRRQRGIDHAGLLAAVVARRLGLPVANTGRATGLARLRATPSQVKGDRDAREANLRGAFAAAWPWHDCTAILVDDVLTTGATAQECAAVLLAAGAKSVIVLTVARAAPRQSIR